MISSRRMSTSPENRISGATFVALCQCRRIAQHVGMRRKILDVACHSYCFVALLHMDLQYKSRLGHMNATQQDMTPLCTFLEEVQVMEFGLYDSKRVNQMCYHGNRI